MEIEEEQTLSEGWSVQRTRLRVRLCSCGAVLGIGVALDDLGQLAAIDCLINTYLRRNGRHRSNAFRVDATWRRPRSRFLYCARCHKRRAWDTFSEDKA